MLEFSGLACIRDVPFTAAGSFLFWLGLARHGTRQVVYLNRPVQDGDVHLSAPFIYADALEELQPKPGMSFLNIVRAGCCLLAKSGAVDLFLLVLLGGGWLSFPSPKQQHHEQALVAELLPG